MSSYGITRPQWATVINEMSDLTYSKAIFQIAMVMHGADKNSNLQTWIKMRDLQLLNLADCSGSI